MAGMRGPRLQVGSAAWVAEERSGALQIAQSEVEEFTFSARNELDWLNEHMAGIFDENAVNIAEAFKTPGKLRGKTPRTARKGNASEARQPLSDVFTSTPNGVPNRFAQHVNRIQSPKASSNTAKPTTSPAKPRAFQVASEKPNAPAGQSQDSGYYGSQDVYSQETRVDNDMFTQSFVDPSPQPKTTTIPLKHSPSHTAPAESPEKTFQTAREDQTTRVLPDASTKAASPRHAEVATEHDDARDEIMEDAPDPEQEATSQQNDDAPPSPDALDVDERDFAEPVDGPSDEARSNSDGSSPIRPMVRKSSLNFASLPAREPLTGGKSLGGHTSRTSHLDLNRKSYYGRQADGTSLGNHARHDEYEDEEEEDGSEDPERMGLGAQLLNQISDDRVNTALNHNRTYTQRLQDQINLLGKSKPSRPSQSLHNIAAVQQAPEPPQSQQTPKSPISKPLEATKTTPGAFPADEDEEDDWADPPQPPAAPVETQSPRPTLPKSHTADIMEGIHQSGRVSGAEFAAPSHDRLGQSASPQRTQAPTSAGFGHSKSASVATMPAISRRLEDETLPLTKAVSVSNPALAAVTETGRPQTPSKSPTRGFRDSPLKQVKNKLSSILKSSKGLLASSAAISAEGKTSMLSPSTTRLAHHHAPSSESLVSRLKFDTKKSSPEGQLVTSDDNKTLPVSRRTRASTEREKEEKRLEKEAKRMEQQEGKLEKAREKEREKARVFSKEQEKLAAMEQQVSTKKTEERIPVKETPKPTRSSPRKIQRAPESTAKPAAQDVDMTDAPSLAPPSIPRSAGPSQIARSKETTRPVKPTREPQVKPKQAPTVIRVKPGSQHSQYHSTSNGSNAAVETSAVPAPQPTPQTASKASKATLQNKPSTQSLKGASSASRPKALDLAAKKKEQDEREAQRRREAKAEMEKKRAAAQEEQRKQEQRRLEAERQKQKDREQAAAKAEARQSANRQAMIEKAKQTRPPPPPVRSQPNGPPDYGHLGQDQLDMGQPARPPSRMDNASSRTQDEAGRPVKTVLSHASKAGVKRTMANDTAEDRTKRAPSKGGPAYQSKDAKRRRTSQDHDELENDHPPNIKGPPVRPSAGFMKELPKKSLYQGGHTQAPSGANLFKATLTSQHQGQMKGAHPMEMAKISKGAIPFAPNSNPAGPTSHKTPVRPPATHATKSTAKAQKQSPRFQNGESIELPEIETDDEDSDNDDARGPVAAWVDSPNLRQALMSQETLDPSHIFGPPAPLNMEEVFSKSKERFHKFRARTSSANWSTDRVTEEDVRKDMAARDRIRREGGWSYEMSKDVR